MTLDHTLTAGTGIASAIAAVAWLISARAKRKAPLKDGLPIPFLQTVGETAEENQLIYNGVDIWGTVALQSRWNAIAAAAACAAAILQVCQAWSNWNAAQ